MSDERVDAIERALAASPGETLAGYKLLKKGVSNGVFGWLLVGGGFISLNNLIATIRPDKTSARTERDTALRQLEAVRGRLAEAATWFEERAKQVGELRSHDGDAYVPGAFGIRAALNGYAQKCRAALATSPPLDAPALDAATVEACALVAEYEQRNWVADCDGYRVAGYIAKYIRVPEHVARVAALSRPPTDGSHER